MVRMGGREGERGREWLGWVVERERRVSVVSGS